MPRKNSNGRRIRGGIPWRGRRKLDHREIPKVIQRLINEDAAAGGGVPVRAQPAHRPPATPGADHA